MNGLETQTEIKIVSLEDWYAQQRQELRDKSELILQSIDKGIHYLQQNRGTIEFDVNGTWGSIDSNYRPAAVALVKAIDAPAHTRNTFGVLLPGLFDRAAKEFGAKITCEYWDSEKKTRVATQLAAGAALPEQARKITLTFPQPT